MKQTRAQGRAVKSGDYLRVRESAVATEDDFANLYGEHFKRGFRKATETEFGVRKT